MLLTQAGGLLGPIAWVLGKIMEGIFYVLDFVGIHNIGISIILFTIIVNLLMLPMTIKQQKFSKLSAKMNPELQAIQKKYKGKTDQASMMKSQEETKAVYDKYGTSPSGSCLQLLIQMPILFALYKVVYAIPAYVGKIKELYLPLVNKLMNAEGAADMLKGFKNSSMYVKQFENEAFLNGTTEYVQNTYVDCLNMASSNDWVALADKFPNLATEINTTYEQISHYNKFLGLNIGNPPLDIIKEGFANGAYLLVFAALMVPFLAAFTQWLNTKLMPTANTNNDPDNPMGNSMKTMNTVMPLMSAVFCFSFPCGIGLYWIAGAVVRCVQQVAINKYIDKHLNFDELIEKNKVVAAEKAKKRKAKNEKLAAQTEALNQISQNATKSTKNISRKANLNAGADTEQDVEATPLRSSGPKTGKGSLAARANMVRDYNENRKQ